MDKSGQLQGNQALLGPPKWEARKGAAIPKQGFSARLYTGIATGHILLKQHASLGLVDDPDCRGCGEEEESLEHFLCHCPSIRSIRLRNLGDYFLENLRVAGTVTPARLIQFIRDTGWVDDL